MSKFELPEMKICKFEVENVVCESGKGGLEVGDGTPDVGYWSTEPLVLQ